MVGSLRSEAGMEIFGEVRNAPPTEKLGTVNIYRLVPDGKKETVKFYRWMQREIRSKSKQSNGEEVQ